MSKVKYQEDGLQISVPTNCPAATHHLLLKGMVATFKQSITSEKSPAEEEGLIALTDLFNCLIPSELALQKANE